MNEISGMVRMDIIEIPCCRSIESPCVRSLPFGFTIMVWGEAVPFYGHDTSVCTVVASGPLPGSYEEFPTLDSAVSFQVFPSSGSLLWKDSSDDIRFFWEQYFREPSKSGRAQCI